MSVISFVNIQKLKAELKKDFKLSRCVKTNNIGKYIGGYVYIHKSEINNISMPDLPHMISLAPAGTNYDVIKIDISNTQDSSITLIESPDFLTSNEPLVGNCVKITINTEGQLSIRNFAARSKNQMVYHHKWLFVSETSHLFCIKQAMERSLEWLPAAKKTNVNKQQIGGSNFWDQWLLDNGITPRTENNK